METSRIIYAVSPLDNEYVWDNRFACLNRRELPRVATFTVEQRVIGGVLELPRFRIPPQRPAVPIREITEVNNRDRSCSEFNIGNAPFSAADAIEPIAMMSR